VLFKRLVRLWSREGDPLVHCSV